MPVACGIVGLPNVGKSTIYNAFTASNAVRTNYPFSSLEPNVAMIDVPDERLERIHAFIETQKIVHASVKVVDIPGLVAGASKGEGIGNKFLGHVKESDAILHVVRCFEAPQVLREGPVDPKSDMEVLELELAMADLDTVTRAVERVSKKARGQDKQALFELDVFSRAKAQLEEGQHLRTGTWKKEEQLALRPLFLITQKPMLYVANVDPNDLAGESAHAQAVATHARSRGAQSLHICGDLECELVGMEAADRAVFQKDFGLTELALPRLIQSTYDLLGLQTFFTAGPKEIKAWTIHRGDSGPVAAGVIHSDFEKAYVRAEVYSVDDLVQYKSEAAIKAAGKLRSEGREYVMRESDVAHFLIGK